MPDYEKTSPLAAVFCARNIITISNYSNLGWLGSSQIWSRNIGNAGSKLLITFITAASCHFPLSQAYNPLKKIKRSSNKNICLLFICHKVLWPLESSGAPCECDCVYTLPPPVQPVPLSQRKPSHTRHTSHRKLHCLIPSIKAFRLQK